MLDASDSLDLATLGGRLQAGSLTPVEMVEGILARIAARGDDKVWIHLLPRAELIARADEAAGRDAARALTPPTTIGVERRTNPFLRADQPGIRARLGLPAADPAGVFAEIRRRKDHFS